MQLHKIIIPSILIGIAFRNIKWEYENIADVYVICHFYKDWYQVNCLCLGTCDETSKSKGMIKFKMSYLGNFGEVSRDRRGKNHGGITGVYFE